MERPMWTCPDCGRQFHSPNASHSCVSGAAVDLHLAGRPPGVVATYRCLEAM